VPSSGPGGKVHGKKQDDQGEIENVDTREVAENFLPINTPQKKEEENEAEEDDETQSDGMLFHH